MFWRCNETFYADSNRGHYREKFSTRPTRMVVIWINERNKWSLCSTLCPYCPLPHSRYKFKKKLLNEIFFWIGPDKIIAASNLTTTEPDGAVKFRSVETKDAAIIPESLPGMLARIAARYPDQAALAYKKNPEQEGFHFINYRCVRFQWNFFESLSDIYELLPKSLC